MFVQDKRVKIHVCLPKKKSAREAKPRAKRKEKKGKKRKGK